MNNRHRDEMDELNLAQQTAHVLESGDCSDRDDAATYELGRLLRQSANHELPESNEDLREQLLATLVADGDAPMVSVKTPLAESSSHVGRKRMWMGLAVGALVAVGGWWLYQPEHGVVLDGGSIVIGQLDMKDSEEPAVVYRMETATRTAPLTRMRTETRTRLVPVQRTRKESKKVQGTDGEWELREVEVPYTENVTQNYQVQVPYTENTTQSYQLKVPYTPDGKRIARADYKKFGIDESELSYSGSADKMSSALQSSNANAFDKSKEAARISEESEKNIAKITKSLDDRAEAIEFVAQGLAKEKGKLTNFESRVNPSFGSGPSGGNADASNMMRAMRQMAGKSEQAGQNLAKGKTDSKWGAPARYYDFAIPESKDGSAKAETNPNVENRFADLATLPQLATTSTNTVVAVPDGGTILTGGIKRFHEGNENGEWYFRDGRKRGESLRFEEHLSREQYAPIYENAFVAATGSAAVSTFSIDVDTASYANMRRFLNSGQTPPRDSIRIEELVNYFQYDYPQPKGDDPFSVNMELATCPWNDTHKLLRVGLKGKEIHVQERPPTNVVYLIDVSGSMNSNDKLPLLKRGFQMMTKQLGENDRVSIVTYAGNAGVALEPTTGDKTKTIHEAIENLTSGGSTHGSAGIELAYKLAQQHFITGGVNKVILATDGDLNVGVTADGALVKLIKQKASEGVFLTVLGFGTGNLQDGKLEKLADNGNGHYAYIDSNREAHRVLVQQMSGSLVTIAKDVKIQIEFNPAEVKSYRLVGYENRMLATKDFDDDRKDAGEIGAGHTVTAIYEIEPTNSVAASFTTPTGMKYQTAGEDATKPAMGAMLENLTGAAASGELATLALRYKKPDENTSKRIEFAIKNDEKSFTSASDDFRFAASVAGFGMLLRGSEHSGNANPGMILELASESMGDDTTGYRAEFIDLVRKAFSR
jgi:Ca-activated chloride channel family protein